jgi:hypothetical protein
MLAPLDVGGRLFLAHATLGHMRSTGTARRRRLHSPLQPFDFVQLQLQASPQTQSVALGLLIRQDSLTDCQHDCKGD